MEVMSATISYKNTVDKMAKHIVYGNIIFFKLKLLIIKIKLFKNLIYIVLYL